MRNIRTNNTYLPKGEVKFNAGRQILLNIGYHAKSIKQTKYVISYPAHGHPTNG